MLFRAVLNFFEPFFVLYLELQSTPYQDSKCQIENWLCFCIHSKISDIFQNQIRSIILVTICLQAAEFIFELNIDRSPM